MYAAPETWKRKGACRPMLAMSASSSAAVCTGPLGKKLIEPGMVAHAAPLATSASSSKPGIAGMEAKP